MLVLEPTQPPLQLLLDLDVDCFMIRVTRNNQEDSLGPATFKLVVRVKQFRARPSGTAGHHNDYLETRPGSENVTVACRQPIMIDLPCK